MSELPTTSGWYDDPQDPDYLRYFDGVVWSEHRAPKELPQAPRPAADVAPNAPTPNGWGQPQQPNQQQWNHQQTGGQQYGPPSWMQQPQQQWGQPGSPFGMLHGRELASWGRRVGAYLVDGLLLGLLLTAAVYPLQRGYVQQLQAWFEALGASESSIDGIPQPDTSFLLATFLAAVGTVAYDVVCTALWGKTIGKRLLGLRVVDVDRPERLPWSRALLRAVVKYADRLTSAIPGLGSLMGLFSMLDLLWPLWDRPLRQAVHDKAARSAVVRD